MRFTAATFLFGLVATTIAAPTTGISKNKRALTVQSYADFQVSDGVAGNALAEVNANFPVRAHSPRKHTTTDPFQIDTSDLASISAADLEIIKDAREVAEDAETGTGGFNEQIDVAGGKNTAAGTTLQNGKIKNKVLKLQLEVLALQIEQAQGETGLEAKIAEEMTKLNNNIALDEEAAGETSTSVTDTFSG